MLKLDKRNTRLIFEDIGKFLTVMIVYHVLINFVGDNSNYFNEEFLKTLLFVCIGIIIYHNFVKKIILKNKRKRRNI